MPESADKRILYISYTGLLEPLGQSQVYRYLMKLAEDHDITLITYENPEDLEDTERVASLREAVESVGINWHPLTYHHSPTLPATIWDLVNGFQVCVRAIRRNDIEIVHTRSYVVSVLGLLCKQLFGTAFVFDMRGFWADERVDGDLWEADSQLYRSAKWFEAQFLRHADVVVSLTDAGVDAIEDFDHVDTEETQFEKIPTCVDLDLFTPQLDHRKNNFVLGYVGSAGTWYRFGDVLECFEILREKRPDSRLRILNRGDHEYINEQLSEFGIERNAVTIKAVDHAEVPAEMNQMDAGIFFYTPTFSKKGTSPTKMGEFLACGIPCVSNTAVGDVESILETNTVGITIDSFGTEAKQQAMDSLLALHSDPAIVERCRSVAESYYSLEAGVNKYAEIYRSVFDDD